MADRSPPTAPRPPERTTGRRPAVFLDRDGTLIEDLDYLADPDAIRFIPGAVEALRRLRRNGFACVIVTNQSGIGRGMITPDQLERVHARLNRLLEEQGAPLDGTYYCPEAPRGGPEGVVEHEDRKPGPGMLIRAALELDLDLGSSWMVGDKLSDVLAGFNAGCLGSIRVRTGKGRASEPDSARTLRPEFPIVDDLAAAAALILGGAHPPGPSRPPTSSLHPTRT
jgi:D-glycero-D-manno-heptose 1,7-bisphosphate phosphatase